MVTQNSNIWMCKECGWVPVYVFVVRVLFFCEPLDEETLLFDSFGKAMIDLIEQIILSYDECAMRSHCMFNELKLIISLHSL